MGLEKHFYCLYIQLYEKFDDKNINHMQKHILLNVK